MANPLKLMARTLFSRLAPKPVSKSLVSATMKDFLWLETAECALLSVKVCQSHSLLVPLRLDQSLRFLPNLKELELQEVVSWSFCLQITLLTAQFVTREENAIFRIFLQSMAMKKEECTSPREQLRTKILVHSLKLR